jgi:hypothetical protein
LAGFCARLIVDLLFQTLSGIGIVCRRRPRILLADISRIGMLLIVVWNPQASPPVPSAQACRYRVEHLRWKVSAWQTSRWRDLVIRLGAAPALLQSGCVDIAAPPGVESNAAYLATMVS